jgi:UDP-3-O-[3-hydroxymyristoyl] glucosamine N-acyltransferase
MRLSELSQMLNSEFVGPEDPDIRGVAGLDEAKPGDITFVSDEKSLKKLDGCRASAVIAPVTTGAISLPSVKCKNPRLAFARALAVFHARTGAPTGISDRASIAATAVIGKDPSIHPCAVVSAGAKIGDRVTLFPGAFVGEGSIVGDDSVIHSNVSIREGVTIGKRVIIHANTVIGSDGFGFVTDGGVHHKIPQVGGVVIEDDVELGAGCAVDRATLGNTVIRRGTKLDNMVHIAHNVTIGEHCLLAGQVGIAGSATIGNYVVMGGQVGIGDHVKIGDRVMVGGGSAITKDMEAGQVLAGYYAMPLREWLKVQSILPKLPEMKKRLADAEKRLAEYAIGKSKEQGEDV